MNMLFKDKKAQDTTKKTNNEAPRKKGFLEKLKTMNFSAGDAARKVDETPQGGSMNPLKWGKEVQEFMDFVNRLTDSGKKKPSIEEFEQIVSAYKSLNTIQRYSASSKMAGTNHVLDAAVRGNNYGLLDLEGVL